MSDTAGRAPARGRGHPGWVMVLSPMLLRSGGQTPAAQSTSSTTAFLPSYTVRTDVMSRISGAGCDSFPCYLHAAASSDACTQQKCVLVLISYAVLCRRGQGNMEAGVAPVVAAAEVMAGLSPRPLLSKAANCGTSFTMLNNNCLQCAMYIPGCSHRHARLLRRCRYKESLQAASSFITDAWPDHVEQALVLNLGPSWMNVDAYSLFRNNVIEIPFKYWESPPGMGLCPLDVAFTVCSSISSWLTLNDDHFVVSGHRQCRRHLRTPCLFMPCEQMCATSPTTIRPAERTPERQVLCHRRCCTRAAAPASACISCTSSQPATWCSPSSARASPAHSTRCRP